VLGSISRALAIVMAVTGCHQINSPRMLAPGMEARLSPAAFWLALPWDGGLPKGEVVFRHQGYEWLFGANGGEFLAGQLRLRPDTAGILPYSGEEIIEHAILVRCRPGGTHTIYCYEPMAGHAELVGDRLVLVVTDTAFIADLRAQNPQYVWRAADTPYEVSAGDSVRLHHIH
jgi:hypothetical protein